MSVESTPVRLLPETASSLAALPRADQPFAIACWLSVDVLLVLASSQSAGGDSVEATAECGQGTVRLAVRSLPYSRPGAAESPSVLARAVLLRLPPGHTSADSLPLVLHAGGPSLRLDTAELSRTVVSLDALLRYELAALDAPARARIVSFLVLGPGNEPQAKHGSRRTNDRCCAKATDEPSALSQLQLCKNLHVARQVLRERLPLCVISPAVAQGLNIDAILAIDDRSFYVQGWMHDEQAPSTRLTAVSPEGSRVEILPRLFRYRRPDVEQFYGDSTEARGKVGHAFIAHLETTAPSMLASGWTFEMGNAAGSELEASGPAVTRDLSTIRDMILLDLHRERLPADRLRGDHIAPALTRLEERRRSLASVESIDQHGHPPVEPEVSIVVPLYGRIDFLEHQLAQFVHDPEFQGADLIYVLDSPDLAEAFRVAAAQLAELYRVPFRAVVMSHNVGFSGVNNVGADLAKGRLLLLLNSDVFPRAPAWLSAMTTFYDSTPGIGALAPKLLYEDDSIQHAGLYFRRLVDTGLWNNEHYYKGLHRTLPAANVARVVPAITAACMMIELALYRQLGGLRGMYIQGDYEDSDLCLRLSQEGRESWYVPAVELYHLEGQSYPSLTRELTGAYNRWLHTHTWSNEIPKLMERIR